MKCCCMQLCPSLVEEKLFIQLPHTTCKMDLRNANMSWTILLALSFKNPTTIVQCMKNCKVAWTIVSPASVGNGADESETLLDQQKT